MAVQTIPWNTGSGNITLSYAGQGDGPVTVASDDNPLDVARSQTVTLRTTLGGTVTRQVTVTQGARPSTPNFILSDGKYRRLSDGSYFNVRED